MKISELLEVRKNPKVNVTPSVYDQLLQYKDNPNIYISFTTEMKLGINPSSTYRTPNGIYSYPLKAAWEYYEVFQAEETGNVEGIPYALTAPYIHVFEYVGSNELPHQLEQYNNNWYESKIAILSKLLNRDLTELADEATFDAHQTDKPFAWLWYVTRQLAGKNSNKWNWLLRQCGFDGVVDDSGTEIIHEYEPVQAVFFSKRVLKHVDMIHNVRKANRADWQIDNSKYAMHDIKHKLDLNDPADLDKAYEWCVDHRQHNKQVAMRIYKSPYQAMVYATIVLRRVWPLAEPYIIQDDEAAYDYWRGLFKPKRWPTCEDRILSSKYGPEYIETINQRNEKYENILIYRCLIGSDVALSNNAEHYLKKYIKQFKIVEFPLLKSVIHVSPAAAMVYATTVLNQQIPELEPLIKTDSNSWIDYVRHFNL